MKKFNSTVSNILSPVGWEDYELIDFGYGKKLERFGKYTFVRPDSQAMAEPIFSKKIWAKADGIFNSSNDEEKGSWKLSNKVPEFWDVNFNNIKIKTLPTPFRHLGFFPEQSVHWDWCRGLIQKRNKPKVLNLFGYSGIASLDAALSGAEVTHVDASKKAINLAFENRNRNNLEKLPIRFLVEDAVNFVKREIRRNNKYDGIILDPPKYGRGPNGEIWRIEEDLLNLMYLIKELLTENPLFLVLTSYAIRSSHISLYYLLESSLKFNFGKYSSGELGIEDSSNKKRVLSCANFARWQFE